MADYSKKFKRRVVILWIRHNMSSSEISRLSGIDHKTLLKWYKRFYPEIAVGGGGTATQRYELAQYRYVCRLLQIKETLKMSNYESKAQAFLFAIINAYRNDNLNLKEDIPKIEIPENGDYTEDLQALIIAISMWYSTISNNHVDLIEITHVMNKMMVQYYLDKVKNNEKVYREE